MPTPIIVVHNDDKTRELATNALRDTGYEVAAYNNPMRVLDAMDGSTRIQVLVTRVDFGPGTLNGVALARMVRHKQPTTKVVFVAQEKNRGYTTELGEFLPVPLDPKALVDAISRASPQASVPQVGSGPPCPSRLIQALRPLAGPAAAPLQVPISTLRWCAGRPGRSCV